MKNKWKLDGVIYNLTLTYFSKNIKREYFSLLPMFVVGYHVEGPMALDSLSKEMGTGCWCI